MESIFSSFIQVILIVLDIYTFILIITALISWVNPDPYNKVVQFLHRATEPVLDPIRRTVPPIAGIDFSIVIVLLAIYLLRSVLLGM